MVFILTLVITFLLQLFLPWYAVLIVSFCICSVFSKTAKIAFWHSFFAILILWTAAALYKSIPNENILATKVAEMFSLKFWPAILATTSLLGALTAGISGICGHYFRKSLISHKGRV